MTGNQSQAPKLQLIAPKEGYSVGEPIEVTLVLKNLTNAPLTVNKRMAINPGQMGEGRWEVKFDVTFPPGKRLLRVTKIRREKLKEDDFTVLLPGEEINRDYPLTDYFWMELPGTYGVKATYHNGNDGSMFELRAWTGDITSNSVSFRVNK